MFIYCHIGLSLIVSFILCAKKKKNKKKKTKKKKKKREGRVLEERKEGAKNLREKFEREKKTKAVRSGELLVYQVTFF